MSAISPEVEDLLRQRDRARAAKDFALADQIRDQIADLGFDVRDSAEGGVALPKPAYETVDPARVPSLLDEPATKAISIHVLYEGFREDLTRFVASLARHCSHHDYEIVITDAASGDGEWIHSLADPGNPNAGDRVRALHLNSDPGWAAARNAALKTSRGAIVVIADLSVEVTGDLLGPVIAAFDDPGVGLAGPWGIVSTNMRDFEASDGPPGTKADAIEGYFLATRRQILQRGLIDEKFKWYRHADIDFSFQVRALGFTAVLTPAPATRHTHRAWSALDDDDRTRRSKKNFNCFLDRFRDRRDLLISS